VSFTLVNDKTNNWNNAILATLKSDFPIYEPRCPDTPDFLCQYPVCRHSTLSLVAYAKYRGDDAEPNRPYQVIPLPTNPYPFFNYVCVGCGQTNGLCEEYCTTYNQELVRFEVAQWNTEERRFDITDIIAKDYHPLRHGFFNRNKFEEKE
jgi:hypothetical protein